MFILDKLEKIRSSPKLNNQQQTAVILSAVEETLRDQNNELSPTAYFAALLSLLPQYISEDKGIINKDVAFSVVYLLDLVTPNVPTPLLRSKFSQILNCLAPALASSAAEAPLLRSSIGCLESLLIAQSWEAWALPMSQTSPRRAIAGLLALANDHRPKVRKRAQDAVTKVLNHRPPSPSLDHPAAELCAATALKQAKDVSELATRNKRDHHWQNHEAALVHALQLIKMIAAASNGWPANKLNALCELLLEVSKKGNNHVVVAILDVFEAIYQGMTDEVSRTKIPRTLEILSDLQPSQDDAQLVVPWMAVVARGWDIFCQLNSEEAFQRLPYQLNIISRFLTSHSYDIRTSSAECMLALLEHGIPKSVILKPSASEWQILENIATQGQSLLSIQYQSAWKEVFAIIGGMIDAFWWHATLLLACVASIGELRANESFNGKAEANAVIAKAIRAMGPDMLLRQLPLNLLSQKSNINGRAWLLPLLRDSVSNANLAHFKAELVPVAEKMYELLHKQDVAEKTTEIKIYETIIQQIWAILPGYCDLPLDLVESFDQPFAEMLSNLLYKLPELRLDICKALELLVITNEQLYHKSDDDDFMIFSRLTKSDAHNNLKYLSGLSNNILVVLFNVYSESSSKTKPTILKCVSAYLSITPKSELCGTFRRVADMLQSSLSEKTYEEPGAGARNQQNNSMCNALLDLIVTMTVHLPKEELITVLNLLPTLLNDKKDISLQKKAYKLISRIPESTIGAQLLADRFQEILDQMLSTTQKVVTPARRDRLAAFRKIIERTDQSKLYIIPHIVPEVILSTRDNNERARSVAFDLLVVMGEKMAQGGTFTNSASASMTPMAEDVSASLEEYFKMVTAGLVSPSQQLVATSITGLARIMYHFRKSLTDAMVDDLVQTIDVFLTSTNREIVRSALGFVKVSVICLPTSVMLGRLHSLVPNLLIWSQEHKARFKSKVKHIFERMIRRFGVEEVEKHCPESDRKLINNIRKARERRTRKDQKEETKADQISDDTLKEQRSVYQTEFDQVVNESDSDSEPDDNVNKRLPGNGKTSQVYIVEDEDDPLDLLDEKALGRISSIRPTRMRNKSHTVAEPSKDPDGKLYLGIESDEEADVMEFGSKGQLENNSSRNDFDAYLAAKEENMAKRGHRGMLKFSNRQSKQTLDEDIDLDDKNLMRRKRVKAARKRPGIHPQKIGTAVTRVQGGHVVKTTRRQPVKR